MDLSEAVLLNETLRRQVAKHEGWTEAEFKTWQWLGRRGLRQLLLAPGRAGHTHTRGHLRFGHIERRNPLEDHVHLSLPSGR